MRFMNPGHDAQAFASACVDFKAKPGGHVNSWSHGKHDIGMPKRTAEADADFIEDYLPVGQPVTIKYGIQTAGDLAASIQQSNMINSGRYDVFTMPGSQTQMCHDPVLVRTFIPQAGEDYEARYTKAGACPTVNIFHLVDTGHSIQLRRVDYVPTQACPEEDEDND